MLRKLAILSFFAGYVAFLVYLVLFAAGQAVSIVFFWIPIIVIVVSLLYQIMNCVSVSGNLKDEILIVSEIFLLTLVFHLMVSRPGYSGLVGHDPHYEYSAAKTIMSSGWPVPPSVQSNLPLKTIDYSEWPMLDLLALSFSQTLGMNLLVSAQLIPLLINSFAVIFLYLVSREIYNDRRVSLIASLAFAILFPYVNFETHFVRESFAAVLFFACLYCLVKGQKTGQKVFQFFSVFLIIVLVFSHHLTSFILLLFLVIAAVLIRVIPRIFKTGEAGERKILGFSLGLPILALVLNLGYWTTVGEFVGRAFSLFLSNLSFRSFGSFGARRFSLSAGSTRVVAASYGNLLFLAVFGILVLSYLLKNRKRANVVDAVFAFFGVFWVFMAYAVLNISSLAGIDFTRLATLGYAFLLLPVAHVMSVSKHRTAVAVLIACFVFLQIFTIPTYYYDLKANPEYSYGSYREYYLPQEYNAANRFTLSGKIIGDWTVYELFGGIQGAIVVYQTDKVTQIFQGNLTLLKGYDWLVFRHEDFYGARVGSSSPVSVTSETYNEFSRTVLMEKLYNNGEVEIYRSLAGTQG